MGARDTGAGRVSLVNSERSVLRIISRTVVHNQPSDVKIMGVGDRKRHMFLHSDRMINMYPILKGADPMKSLLHLS